MGEAYRYGNGAEFKAPQRVEKAEASIRVDLPWTKNPVDLPLAREEIDGTIVLTASAIETHPTFSRVSGRLNGHTVRAERLLLQRAKEYVLTGRFSEGYPVRRPNAPTVTGFQTGEQDPNTRVRAFAIVKERPGQSPVFIRVARCMATDDGKVFGTLDDIGYERGQKTDKRAKNRR